MAKAKFSQGATRKAYQQSYRMRTGASAGMAHVPKTKFDKAPTNNAVGGGGSVSTKRDYGKGGKGGSDAFGVPVFDPPQITNLRESWIGPKKPRGFK
jgi:hypothetical protein